MNTPYIICFPFHPDRFNPDSVEQRIALIAAFKAARPAVDITKTLKDCIPVLAERIEFFSVEAAPKHGKD